MVSGSSPGPAPAAQARASASRHPIQLPRVAPTETPQKGTQRGRRLDRAAQHALRPASAQRVGVVNAVTTGQRRRHQRQQLVSCIGMTRRISQINAALHQLAQSQMMGQRDRQDQPSIGHQAMIVEGDLDAVGLLRW